MEIADLSKILDHIKQLYAEKEALSIKLIEQQKHIDWNTQSECINELSTALAKAQAEMRIAGKDKENPYFKSRYADWQSVVDASRPALTKFGISVQTPVVTEESGVAYMICQMTHSSGQWIRSRMRYVPPKTDIQGIASYNTSLKRLMYSNLTGVVVGDEDDDGEKAVAETRELYAKGVAVNNKYDPKSNNHPITPEQLDELEYELAKFPDIVEQILEGFKIQSLADMPKDKYSAAIRRVREITQLREGK